MKKTINFATIAQENKNTLAGYVQARYDLAKEDARYKAEKKPLLTRKESILKDRENDINAGMSWDEATSKHSIEEVDRLLRVAERTHKELAEPFRQAQKDSYTFIPEGMYEAYKKKISEGKRGDFLDNIEAFFVNLGIIENPAPAVRKVAESISDKLGARVATSNKLLKTGALCTEMSKHQFNNLFMAVFCDMMIEKKVIAGIAVETKEETETETK